MIHELDHSILRAFLEREANMYLWKQDGGQDTRRQEFIDRMFGIITNDIDGEFDYVHIQSISNMGLMTSELVLTCKNWAHGKSAYFSLPPSPRGGTTPHIKEGR